MNRKFEGFESPNFTMLPNEYLEYTFSPYCELSKVQMQIMNFVFRETYGWQDKHKMLMFSAADVLDMLNIVKKKVVTDALTGLVDQFQFLESIEVGKLPVRARATLEKKLGRKIQPRQKVYRLRMKDGKKRSWSDIETPKLKLDDEEPLLLPTRKKRGPKTNGGYQTVPTGGYQTVSTSGYQTVPTGGYQTVSTSGYQTVPTSEPESLAAVGTSDSLNKVLNKELNTILNKENLNLNLSVDNIYSVLQDTRLPKELKVKIKVLLTSNRVSLSVSQILDIESAYLYQVSKQLINPNGAMDDIEALNDWDVSFTIEKMLRAVRDIENMKGLIQTWLRLAFSYKREQFAPVFVDGYQPVNRIFYDWLEEDGSKIPAQGLA